MSLRVVLSSWDLCLTSCLKALRAMQKVSVLRSGV
jgi:hypothetical protein